MSLYLLGRRMFDLPSGLECWIVEVDFDTIDGERQYYVRVDSSIPLDPTRDGAFPDRWRNPFEVCDLAQAEEAARSFIY